MHRNLYSSLLKVIPDQGTPVIRGVFFYLILTLQIQSTFCKRVVVVPVPNVSHTRYLTNVARALTSYGHEAWVCMPVSVAEQNVLNMTGIHVLPYSSKEINVVEDYMRYVRDAYWEDRRVDMGRMNTILLDHMTMMVEDKKLEAAIRGIRPDLMIIDNVPHMRTIAVMAYKLDIPFAFVGPLYDPIPYRVPFTTATMPSTLFPHTDDMTFLQRLISFAIHYATVVFEVFSHTDAVRRYAPDKPYLPIRELTSRSEIVLIESDPVMDYPKVSLPNVKLIGGTAVTEAIPLVEPFKSFVDTAENGVVVVSFGTYIIDLPNSVFDKLLTAFQRLNLKVVWRVNATSPDPEKILTSQWIPQNDLLGHPNVKAFVSHCGQSSQYEALFHGVPTLCVPIFMDQAYNAERARSKGFGKTIDLKIVSDEDIFFHIQEIVSNPSYAESVQKASRLFKLNYGLPMNKAAFWLDHVIHYGGRYLRYAGQTMPGYQFYCLDILSLLILVTAVVCLVFYYMFKVLLVHFLNILRMYTSIIFLLFHVLANLIHRFYCKDVQFKSKLS
ncbi:2-hydroxyacylsphingosine 1-beta-galactosyltransferase-like isoform X1 [Biomphalaria glabrata]|uniref:2-hydroxyacylsphingosine 1-beta-galactosyltransferase-like isoform X1 n=1 Tax=Biomphalaria glabrata TaxID=6526 RepID=A0A9U8DU08_BIOGL|nr:2-hydroxyacylsphingosine 1-beta-galactosyltransferase-like isoform X1 [Biomphalaria glabrata]